MFARQVVKAQSVRLIDVHAVTDFASVLGYDTIHTVDDLGPWLMRLVAPRRPWSCRSERRECLRPRPRKATRRMRAVYLRVLTCQTFLGPAIAVHRLNVTICPIGQCGRSGQASRLLGHCKAPIVSS